MSKNLTANQINSFDQRVKQAYQGASKLRSTVQHADNIVGATHRFNTMGKGLATKRVSQTDVIPMNITHGNATATIEDWNAPEYTDLFDQQKVNYKEQDKLAGVISMAIGRREDQLIIDALEAASTTLTVADALGGTGMNTAKARRARRLLNDQGVPSDRTSRYFAFSAEAAEMLLGDSDASDFDKNAIKALVDGELTFWVGFNFLEIETRTEGGLPKSGNDRTCFAWHNESCGLASGIQFRTEVNYIAQKTSWLANGLFAAGSVAIDALGIVEITVTET